MREQNKMAGKQVRQDNTDMKTLQSELKQGTFRKVYLLSGEERYLVLQFRDHLIEAAVSPDDTMNLNVHKEAAPDLSKVMDECLAMPFFSDRRMVVLQDSGYFAPAGGKNGGKISAAKAASNTASNTSNTPATSGAAGTGKGRKSSAAASSSSDILIDLISRLPETTVLLFVESAVDKRSRLYKAVSREGLAVDFGHPDEDTLGRWVLSNLSEHRIRITKDALNMLLERSGPDMSMIHSQLEKLISCAGDGGTLTAVEVGALVTERLETKIFDLVDAAGHRNRREAISRYDELIRMWEEPNRILYFLGKQFNLLYQAKILAAKGKGTAEMMQAMDVKYSFQIRKYTDQARYFTLEQLRSAVADCAQMEQQYKTGKIQVRLAVEMLLVKYSR